MIGFRNGEHLLSVVVVKVHVYRVGTFSNTALLVLLPSCLGCHIDHGHKVLCRHSEEAQHLVFICFSLQSAGENGNHLDQLHVSVACVDGCTCFES